MAEPVPPPPVKLLCGMISARPGLFEEATAALSAAFGSVDLVSETMVFDFTHYYDAEMGHPLWRQFLSFAPTRSPDCLRAAKLRTDAIESEFAARLAGNGPPRPVNLDPGYVESSKLVLASRKNFSHRLYLGDGVYGEVTLFWRRNRWEALPWTFPDFASGRYDAFLTACRSRLRETIGTEDTA